ncbi:glucoamylase family protein [Clostridium sp. C2-6-12]|uniref:GH36-type glycosyl hydrolase domain-containing protein n=1 Tax=Clostridium sp. C2-6-12 TaxID=2698832 RepID=UPI001371D8E4|nr:glucoamylase family protein [Clostridium sp. C2-6-12]
MEKNNSYGVRRNVLRELSDAFSSIHDNYKYFSKLSKEGCKVLGASEWLLDNIYLIEKEYKAIKREMPIDYFEGLTSIDSKEMVPRIFLVAKDYINNQNEIDCDKLIAYINKLQEKRTEMSGEIDLENNEAGFTMGELWAFPLMLKTAIIISLSEYTDELTSIQKEIIQGKITAEKVIDIINNNPVYCKNVGELNNANLKESNMKDNLNILYQELRSVQVDFDHVSHLFLREFFRVLRENSIEDERFYEFMETNWNLSVDYEKSELKSQLREEVLENYIGEYITHIRKIEGISWRKFFENTSLVEKKLKKDPQKVYSNMEFKSKDYYRHKLERLARKLKVNEIDLTNNILELAQKSMDNNEDDYKCHVGYYLIDDGIKELESHNNRAKFNFSENMYLAMNILGTLLISFFIIYMTSILGIAYTRTQYLISFLLILIPVNEIIIGITNWTVNKASEIRLVPKLNFSSGIPEESKTVVVIPAITNSKEKIKELMKKLEVAYCGNKDKNLYFALLCDFLDSKEEVEKNDEEVIKCGIECARKLNEKYSYEGSKSNRFFFFSRVRVYNDKQKVYMGRERKRGKLMEFMALIRGSNEHTFNVFSSDIKELRAVKYLITLDEDTFMPRESAVKLVAAMSHVLNSPKIKDNRVVRGYGVMQPKVSISLEAKNQTYFSRIFGGEEGVDGYSTAYSDTYQDLFGEGSFTGKGIINIDKFYEVLHNTIKDNKILSHDLLEGGIARCALVSDVEFIDGYPGSYESSCKRLHRWVRGDWQLIGWLFSNKLTLLYKWKVFDNLRRSLLAPNLLLALILSLTVLSAGNQIAALCFFALISSLVFTVTDFVVTPKNKLMGTFKNLEQVVLIVSFIPYQSYLMVHAILVTLFRVIFSKKNMLEWQSAEFVEKNSSNDFLSCFKRMWISPVMGMVILYLSFFNSIGVIAYNLAVAILWIISPYFAYCISMETTKDKNTLNNEEKSYLQKIARRIYAYYEDFVNEENNYLAPDNYQEKPFKGVAHRTSPTNIGMGLISNVTAYDLGYITMWEFIDKTELTLNSMKELERVHGHFLNWYDTKSRKPLWPRYVSTVDSGNLLSDLWVLKQAIEEVKYNEVIRIKETSALNDVYKIIEEEADSIKIKFLPQHNIGEYLNILKEALYKLQDFKEEQKLNILQKLSEEKNKISNLKENKDIFYEADILKKNKKLLYELSNEINDLEPIDVKLNKLKNSNKDKGEMYKKESLYDVKLNNEELNYWLNKLIDEIKKKIQNYNNIFEGLEKLYSKEFFEGVPNLIELIHRCEEYRRESGDNFKENLGQKIQMFKSYVDKIDRIIKDIDNLTKEMDFNFLYDNTRELFSIGYNVEENSLGNSYYDLLASESRIASFVAIAKNDVPEAHYFKLSRAMTNAFHTHSLVSWSGTMFEYFMPSLIMRNYPKTLFSQTYKAVIKAQISYAKQKKIPWGISEAAFYEFDAAENYQYKAFGVPGLGLKRGLEDELVVSPYSTLMTVPFAKNTAIKNLKRLEKAGATGRYGFIEAIDYTMARQGKYIMTFSEVKNQEKPTSNSNFDKIENEKNVENSLKINKNHNNDMLIGENYTQNVDNNLKNVDNYAKKVDSRKNKYIKDINNSCVENVDNVDNFEEEYDRHVDNYDEDKFKTINNPQKINKVVNYMVHHLGMSLMALDNILQDNILINRFHTLPEVKATELLLKEKIPQHVVFERNDDFSIKNRYFEGEIMVPRNFKQVKQDNPQVLLLSNGEYSTMITASGSGYSKKNDMMLYRWKGNSTSDDSGMFFYIKNLNSNDYWSSTFEPCKTSGDKYEAEFNLDKAKFIRKEGNIKTEMEIVVSSDENFEVRKLTLNNLSDKARSLEITSYMEITLAAFSADAAHPAFSNLFIQTEYEEGENILIGSRRGRVKGAKVPYIFHKIVSEGELEGPITYETSRINFIGRNRELKSPVVMDNDKSLSNTVGTVLDPIMSLRARIRLEPNSKKEIYFLTGISDSKEQIIELCRQNNDFAKLNKVFKNYSISTQLELKNLGIRSGKANSFQSAASEIFFLTSNRKNREEYIVNIKKHQKDLWAYGISGDLPIIMAVIETEEDTNLVLDMIKFHYYLKLKGLKLDLIIYNNEEISYEAPLQKNILDAIRMSSENSLLNKPGGIFIHNKATMDEEVKNLLIGISRIYVDSKNSLKSYIYVEKNMKPYMELKEEGLNSQIALRNNSNVPYAEYDHDEDLITGEDLLKGMKVPGDIAKVKKENLKIEGTQNIEESQNIEKHENIEEPQSIEESQSIKNAKSIIGDVESSKEIKEAAKVSTSIEKTEIERTEAIEEIKEIEENKKLDADEPVKNNSNKEFNEISDFNIADLDFFNGYGGFNKKDKSYIIKLSDYKNTPAPWINVISNEDFGFHISETGAGYTWCGNSRENKITPWSNDYIRDPAGEALYVKDNISGKYFSISPKPVRDSGDYLIKHSFGYSEFIHKAYDLNGKLEVFAPKGERLKIQRVTLENLSEEDRSVSVFYYSKLVLGVYEYDSSRYISTYISGMESDQDINSAKSVQSESDQNINFRKSTQDINSRKSAQSKGFIGGKNPYSQYFGKLDAYLTILGGEALSFTGDNKAFIGVGGELSKPEALNKEKLNDKSGGIYDPCLAAQTTIKLKKGEKKQLVILFGQEERDKIENIINKYEKFANVEAELDKVKQYWSHFLGNIQVKTPDKSLDYLLNGWLLYQTLSCRYLSRSAFYQSGGAYGFRDQLQDSMALGVVNPEIPKAQILRSASRQYVEGDVQHWWHPVVNSGIRTRFSDDLLWLPYVTAEYINSTGDYEILEKTAPYLEDEPLREGEDERYTIVNQSSKQGTIYEHCLKAIEKSLKFGSHNIPLMGSGDWNDGMSTVGNEGKGESVWLGWFLYSILDSFIEIAKIKKDEEVRKHFEETKEFIRENLEKNAWDGGWYRRAYFDDGTPLGSRENPECQIDSLAQSWSIISGAFENNNSGAVENSSNNNEETLKSEVTYSASEKSEAINLALEQNENSISENQSNKLQETEVKAGAGASIQGNPRIRAIEAMEAVERNLVKSDKGMILLLAPPFDNSYLEPGYIKGYVPGVRENGGQYTHAAVWVILALTKLGLGDKAVKYFNMINPINHSRTELECMTYKLEPYVMAADVYIKEPHAGRGGWSWYTGASGWMYRVGIENILGLRKVKDKGYIVNPCVPMDWKEFQIKISNEKEDYTIKVSRINKENGSEVNSHNSSEVNKHNTQINNNEMSHNKIKVVINGEIITDNIIPRNCGKLDVLVYF